MKRLLLTIFACLIFAETATATDYYASTSGSGTTCSIASPCDIQTLLNDTAKCNNNTFYLRGGTYTRKLASTLDGCTVRSYPGEWAIIDGNVTTTLTAGINSSVTSISVASTAGFTDGLAIVIDDEVLGHLTAANATTLNGLGRGWGGPFGSTTAASHSNGATVYLYGDQFVVSGTNTTYRDFEIKNTLANRDYSTIVANSSGVGVFVTGTGNSFINLVIHDNGGGGVFTGSATANTLFYGCLVYNNGVYNTVRGHGFYTENSSGYSRIYDNIVLNNFNLGAQAYGQTGPYYGGDWSGNIIANNGSPAGIKNTNLLWGTNLVQSPTANIDSCVFYHIPGGGGNVQLGYESGIETATFTNNYVLGTGGTGNGIEVTDAVTNATVTGNVFDSTNASILAQAPFVGYTWNNNAYYHTPSTGVSRFSEWSVSQLTFANWKLQSGYDASSTNSASAPSDIVTIRPNSYQSGRAHIWIYAPSGATSINVNLSTTGLANGQSYTIKNAFDYNGSSVASGSYNSSSPTISVSLTGNAASVATPTGMVSTPASTAPEFVVLILEPQTITNRSVKVTSGVRLTGARIQ